MSVTRTGTRILDLAVGAAAAPSAGVALHLGLLTVAALARRRNPLPSAPSVPQPHFVIVVPAHDEAAGIAATVRSLAAMDYPVDRRRILVIADNCTDDTAARAASAGADVLERTDQLRRGKGFALAVGLRDALGDPAVDAVVVVDADTLVEPGLLLSAAAAMQRGAMVMQADYRVRDPLRSWRTTLMEIAFAAIHTVRNRGRERLGLSVGLRGNGMVFTRKALEICPYSSFGLVEDIEYAARLVDAGIRVAFLEGVTVRGDMPAAGKDAASQRLRWEEGRRRLRREAAPRLARKAIRQRSPLLADAALELSAPPLARLAVPLIGAAAVAFGLGHYRQPARWSARVATLGLTSLAGHVTTAWAKSGTGGRGIAALAKVPAYAAWKLTLAGPRRAVDGWVRTPRSEEKVAV